MFGNKQVKLDRLQRIVEELHRHPAGLIQSELAARLSVPSSTIVRDFPLLEDRGVLLQEDAGKLNLSPYPLLSTTTPSIRDQDDQLVLFCHFKQHRMLCWSAHHKETR